MSMQTQQDPGVEMVRLMLGRHFITDEKFQTWMLKVDHDENGALNPKEWKRLLRKIKKKDDKTWKHDDWELTSIVAAGSFKACLTNYDPSVEYSELQLFYKDLGAWVYPEPTKEQLEEQLKQTNLVRNMLANALDLPASFDVYMAEIDADGSNTVSAQEFVKLLMLIQQTSNEFKLTLKLAAQCWNHLLLQVNKSDQEKVSEKRKARRAEDFQYAEVHFSDLKEWIFARKISPAGLKGWQLEDEVNDEQKEDDGVTMKFFKVAEDAFKYLETVNHVVIEELGQGQYMAINAETQHNFLLMEERSNYWCNLFCYPAHPLLVKFYNPSAPMIIPERVTECCGISMFTKPESKYFRPAGSARAFLTFEKSGLHNNCSQVPFLTIKGFGCQNVPVCCSCCRSETWMHSKDIPMHPTEVDCCCNFKCCCISLSKCQGTSYDTAEQKLPGNCNKKNMYAHSKVPLFGGGLVPTVNLMHRGQTINQNEEAFGKIQGPTFFGGCLGLCTDTVFNISSGSAGKGDLGSIVKLKPKARVNVSVEDEDIDVGLNLGNDRFKITFIGTKLTGLQKSVIIGEVLHLNYLFFENEEPPCTCTCEDWKCLVCNCYVCGWLLPIRCKLKEKDNSNGADLDNISNAVKSRQKELRSRPNWAKN